jgi:hypothetical protein
MTIPEWNLILNVTVLVLMTAYGFWLRHIATQQDKLKTNTIESLNAVVVSKDAEIARLKGEIAPEIAKSYRTMMDHAEEMTKKANSLEQETEKLRNELGEKEGLLSTNSLLGKVDGLIAAAEMTVAVQQLLGAKMKSGGNLDASDVFVAINNLAGEVLGLAQATNDHARALHLRERHGE